MLLLCMVWYGVVWCRCSRKKKVESILWLEKWHRAYRSGAINYRRVDIDIELKALLSLLNLAFFSNVRLYILYTPTVLPLTYRI